MWKEVLIILPEGSTSIQNLRMEVTIWNKKRKRFVLALRAGYTHGTTIIDAITKGSRRVTGRHIW
jgi:hypothetical protein